jgi:hypothetical protein
LHPTFDTFDYSGKSDDELCELFIERDGLRPEAQSALQGELARRGLTARDVARFQENQRLYAAADSQKKRSRGAFGGTIRDGRKTLHWWREYKRQTGSWPWSSIAIHAANWAVIFLAGFLFTWWAADRHLPRWQIAVMILALGIPYLVAENWAKNKVKLALLRNARQSSKPRIEPGVRPE